MPALTAMSSRLASLVRHHSRAALGGSGLCCIVLAELASVLVTRAAI